MPGLPKDGLMIDRGAGLSIEWTVFRGIIVSMAVLVSWLRAMNASRYSDWNSCKLMFSFCNTLHARLSRRGSYRDTAGPHDRLFV
jgi:hypothetical protein